MSTAYAPAAVEMAFWQDNRNFAEAFNRVLFDGRAFFRAEDLEDSQMPDGLRYPHAPILTLRTAPVPGDDKRFRIVKHIKKMRLTLSLVVIPDREGTSTSHTDHARSLITVFLYGKDPSGVKNIVSHAKSG